MRPNQLHPAVAAITAAVCTAALLTAVLWRQHAVHAWPFASAGAHERPAGTSGAPAAASATPEASVHGRVHIDVEGGWLEELGIHVEPVRREAMTQVVRAVATIVPDESSIAHVHTRVSGWVEELHVNTTGQTVTAGQPLLRIFSQELLSSQTEYLAARRHAQSGIASAVVEGGRTRLGVLGMTPAEIDAIEEAGAPMRLVTVAAPRSGVVVNRGVTVGTSVDPSTTLVTIADLSRVWVLAEVPEASIGAVRAGSVAALDFPGSGHDPFRARVDFVYPTLTERTRTLRVRLPIANRGGSLRPGLYGTAVFEHTTHRALTVPRDAVVDTGRQQHVFVATPHGFEPRAVTLGVWLADRVEVQAGLVEGEHVVASGVFLLDSESRLRATGGTGGAHQHGTPAAPSGDAGQPARAPAPARPVEVRDLHREPAAPQPAPPHDHSTHGSGSPADPHAHHPEQLP